MTQIKINIPGCEWREPGDESESDPDPTEVNPIVIIALLIVVLVLASLVGAFCP